MNKNEKQNALSKALGDLKKLVFGSDAKNIKSVIKYKFEIVEDTAGQTIQYPALEVGAPVTVGDSEGGEVAPDGNYQIDEKTSIVVKDGVIESIDAPEVAEELESEENAPETNNEVAEQVIAVVEEAQAQIESLNTEIAELKEAVAQFSTMNENVVALTNAVAKFSKEPIAQSVTKQEFTANTKEDKIKNLAGILNKKK